MANILTSSIGKKLIMSISGLFLIVFLLLHVSINLFSVIDLFTGSYGSPDGLFKAGCDFMSLPIVDTENRLVGIISHVDLLKENINKQIKVTKKTCEGSSIQIIS